MLKLCVFVIVAVATLADANRDWFIFKTKYNKHYASKEIERNRKDIWFENRKYISQHNELYSKGLSSFYVGENEYADMTSDEFLAEVTEPKMSLSRSPEIHKNDFIFLPESVDWRKKGYVTPVENQGQMGQSWTFSATGAMEGQHAKSTGKLVSLSEANLADCAKPGGWPYLGYRYVIENGGIDTAASYPTIEGTCKFNKSGIGATFRNYSLVDRNEQALQQATADIGPISVCIDASRPSFQLYSGGVYDDKDCSSTQVDHCTLVVGYGVQAGTPYWIVKNSWGVAWGNRGYILMSRNKGNQCGIASFGSYPIV